MDVPGCAETVGLPLSSVFCIRMHVHSVIDVLGYRIPGAAYLKGVHPFTITVQIVH